MKEEEAVLGTSSGSRSRRGRFRRRPVALERFSISFVSLTRTEVDGFELDDIGFVYFSLSHLSQPRRSPAGTGGAARRGANVILLQEEPLAKKWERERGSSWVFENR